MIKIRNIHRIAIAVKDLDASVERFRTLFGIVPFNYGIAQKEKYHWVAFELGEGQCTMEFLSPWNDPDGEVLIGKFIRQRGEGLYMITLRTEGDADETVDAMRALDLQPSWGSVAWNDVLLNASGDMAAKWQEHYIKPKDACGVLFTLATIDRKLVDKPATAPDEYKLAIAGKN